MPAQASIYNNTFAVTVSEGVTTGVFDTYNGNPFAAAAPGSNTAAAAFTFNGPLNFGSSLAGPNFTTSGDLNSTFGFSASNISSYTPACTANCNVVIDTSSMTQAADFTSLTAFLGSSGSEAITHYGSYYTFDLGVLCCAGTTLVITHDDGVALYQGSTPLHQTTSGLTGAGHRDGQRRVVRRYHPPLLAPERHAVDPAGQFGARADVARHHGRRPGRPRPPAPPSPVLN